MTFNSTTNSSQAVYEISDSSTESKLLILLGTFAGMGLMAVLYAMSAL